MDSLPTDHLSDVEISEAVEIRTHTVRLKNATPMSIPLQGTGRLALLESNVNLKGPDAYKTRSDRSNALKGAWAAIDAHKAGGDLRKANAIARAWAGIKSAERPTTADQPINLLQRREKG